MKPTKLPFQEIWFVVERQYRTGLSQEWETLPLSDLDRNIVCFLLHRRYCDINITRQGLTTGRWAYDPTTDVISVRTDLSSDTVKKCVFTDTATGTHLYVCDAPPHVRPSAESIVEWAACIRYRLVKQALKKATPVKVSLVSVP
jgi:hypothetical protein